MGALAVVVGAPTQQRERRFNRVRDSLVDQGFVDLRCWPFDDAVVLLAAHASGDDALFYTQQGEHSFALCNGPFWYRDAYGEAGLQALLRDWTQGHRPHPRELWGNFSAVISDHGTLYAFTDALNFCKFYMSCDGDVLSSSWLVAAQASEQRTLHRQSALETILIEGSHREATLLEEVSALAPRALWSGGKVRGAWCSFDEAFPVSTLAPEAAFERSLELLQTDARRIAAAFPGRVSSALSAGFDSRLILAALRSTGSSSRLFVYGKASDDDCALAARVAQSVGLPLEHIDKAHSARWSTVAEVANTPKLAMRFFDGFAIDGLFGSGVDAATRLYQGRHQHIVLNGGGGEIFRDFFHLADRPYRAKTIYNAFYGSARFGLSHGAARGAFSDACTKSIAHAVGQDDPQSMLSRAQVELVYGLYRCSYWMGRNNHLANRYSAFLTPLITPELLSLTAALPPIIKRAGAFESRLIAALDPALSAAPSSYGFNFSQGPGARAKAQALWHSAQPPAWRGIRARTKMLLTSGRPTPNDGMRQALPGEWLVFEKLPLKPPRSMGQLQRLASLEFMVRQLNVQVT